MILGSGGGMGRQWAAEPALRRSQMEAAMAVGVYVAAEVGNRSNVISRGEESTLIA